MDWVLAILLFLHIMGAIIAFGPTFAFPLIASSAQAAPEHMNFALKVQKRVASGLVTPLAIFQGITGLLLVWRIGFEVLKQPWLILGIVLYLTALTISFVLIYPALRTLLEASATPPPPGASGPPPHVLAAARRIRMASMTNAVLIVLIVALMIGGSRGFFLNTPIF